MWWCKFLCFWQVQPDLKQLQRIVLFFIQQRKHFTVLYAFASSHPLHIAKAKTTCCSQRIGMINQSFCNNRYSFKATVWVSRKPGHLFTMIHAPFLVWCEVLSNVAPGKRYRWAHYIIAFRIKVFVMNTKEKGILCLPG